MELITLYNETLEKQKNLRIINKRKKVLSQVREEWLPFLESESHTVSVYAGRGMGKTHNTVSRVLLSEHDCIVYCNSESERRMLCRDIDVRWENECLYKNRHIKVLNINSELSEHLLYQLEGKEVIFHEFDSYEFCRYVELYRNLLSRAEHIVCVGTLIDLDKKLSAKLWFRDSDVKYFIDGYIYRSGLSGPQAYPSHYKGFIDRLPPSSYSFELNNFLDS
ncbi:hypothetical protein B14_200011 (plasmid) [Bacillus licheniformis]|uniref:hypothetical protein n=1 Tax=Bacillus licheniformis TaxID=1402 RepID=UPI0009B7C256|nr:hypothetical protein [Bacillus licheniformis]ARC67222.1 hypothetical protein B14_200011 [Bacillus licheniformis]ARW46139.1 hypothetical protein S100141_04919 [Bacillus licheniformis]MDE1421881.1 hypothetical protein [Bacillus licheniformis]MEC0475886.1 hypothetical protein [Bacillus licheniformis]QAS18785.1 hypothetical protein EQJ69_22955 [Bacillus licheniformis]